MRCSSLPLISICAQARHAPKTRIEDPDDGPARLGTACHAALADFIRGNTPDLGAIADKNDVELWELEKVYGMAKSLWFKVTKYFLTAKVEVEMSTETEIGTLTGHTDVLDVFEGELRLADWKSGFLDHDAEAQMRGYAYLGMIANPECDTVWASVVRVRDGTMQSWRWGRAEMHDWLDSLLSHVQADAYRPGPHCAYCPRRWECEGAQQYTRGAIAMIVEEAGDEPLVFDPAIVPTAYARLQLAEKACKMVREALRQAVARAGGRIESEGGSLAIKSEERKPILFAPGEPILREMLGDALPNAIKVVKGEAEKIVKANAPPRGGAAAWRNVMSRLDAAGAIGTETIEKLEFSSVPKQLEVSQ